MTKERNNRKSASARSGGESAAANSPLALQRILPGATLGQLHRATGLSMSMLSKVFSGQRSPSIRALKVIALELGTTMDRVAFVLEDTRRRRERPAVEKLTA